MNYICEPRYTVPAILAVNVQAEEELKAGDVVAINSLVDTEENREVYAATMPAAGDIRYAIIVNQGIEELADGRRPEGQPNFTTFTYKAGTTLHAVMLGYQPVPFAISNNQIDGTPAAGKFLAPKAGQHKLAVVDTKADVCLAVEKIEVETPMGGLFGMTAEKTTFATVL
nr:MAG TPA: hypothetical protein [Caudoviricetes sp.]